MNSLNQTNKTVSGRITLRQVGDISYSVNRACLSHLRSIIINEIQVHLNTRKLTRPFAFDNITVVVVTIECLPKYKFISYSALF